MDEPRISPSRHNKTEPQLRAVAVELEADPGIKAAIANARIVRHAGRPSVRIVPEEIVADTRQEIAPCDFYLVLGADKFHAQTISADILPAVPSDSSSRLRARRPQRQPPTARSIPGSDDGLGAA